MRTMAAVAVVVAGLVLVGCGGSGTKTVTVGQSTATTQTTLSDDPFCKNGKDTQNGSPCTPQSTDTTTTSTDSTTDSTPSNVIHADVGKTVKLDSLSAKIENVSI